MNIKTNFSGSMSQLAILEVPSVGADGVLPHDLWNEPLAVNVPTDESIIEGSVISLILNSATYAEQTVTTGGTEDPAFNFFINNAVFPSGDPLSRANLSYRVKNPESEEVIPSPFIFTVIFDKEAPGGKPPPYLGFDDDQLAGIYPEDVSSGYLDVKLAPWSGKAVGDTLTPWLGKEAANPGNSAAGLLEGEKITVTDPLELGKSITVKFPKSALESLGDIPQHFGYQLADKLGNVSEVSPTRQIDVHLNDKAHRKPDSRTKGKVTVVRKGARSDGLFKLEIKNAVVRASDGRIKVADLANPIVFNIKEPATPIYGNVAQLYVNGYEPDNAVGELAYPELGSDFELSIPVEAFPAPEYPFTKWSVDYRYYDVESEDQRFSNEPIQIIFDQIAPGGEDATPAPISVPDELINNGVSISDLTGDPAALPLHIAAWFDEDLDDQVELWLGTGTNEASGKYLDAKPAPVSETGTGVEVLFPLADLITFSGNPVYFGYRVTDWAGNRSQLSNVVPLDLYLNDQPSDLLAPQIPEAAPYNPADGNNMPPGTGMLTWNKANTSTTVQIPTYTNVKVDDRIYVQWGVQGVTPMSVTQKDIDDAATNGYLLLLEVDFKTTVFPVGSQPNLAVNYVVRRTDTPDKASPMQYVRVNLETPGGPDPDPTPETPEHDNMKPLEVLSSVAGSTPNLITPEGYDKTATITIPRTGADNEAIWKLNDTVTIYWGGPDEDPAPITITSANQGSNLIVPLPADFIAKNGTGSIPVYYTLTRDLGDGNLVTARAIDTTVIVQSAGEAPGGLGELLGAVFPESLDPSSANPNRRITRAVGLDGTTLRVPLLDAGGQPLENVAVGDSIIGEFYGVDDPANGPGADIDPNKPRIEASVISIDHKIVADDLTNGYYEVAVPYSKTYTICRNLSVTDYSITNAAGITKAAPRVLILFALNQAGGTCDLPTRG
jgi:hypothetical protein